MGSENGEKDEQPVHTVYQDNYYIDKYEVSNVSYKACVDVGICKSPTSIRSDTREIYYGNPQYNEYPVVFVSWNMANTYCQWRGARLPTEAEWEKAARGTEARTYPWGNELIGSVSNFCDRNCTLGWADGLVNDGYADTAPIDSFLGGISPYDVYNLAGNVREWVSSLYRPYPYNSNDGREELTNLGGERYSRGGAYYDPAYYLRATFRGSYFLSDGEKGIGFRCARDANP